MSKMISWNWPSLSRASLPQSGWWNDWSPYLGLSCRGSKAPEPELASDFVIALVGLAFEQRIAAGPGVLVICRNARSQIHDSWSSVLGDSCRGIISFGVAGGLASDLLPGDCVVASSVIDYPSLRFTNPRWSGNLLQAIPDARYGPILGVDSVIADAPAKRNLHTTTGAVAVDMESHHVARLAASYGLAFTAIRVIVDPADRAVPSAAALAMASDGSADISSMVREVLAQPSQLSALLRLVADAFVARAALVRLRRVLGPTFVCGE